MTQTLVTTRLRNLAVLLGALLVAMGPASAHADWRQALPTLKLGFIAGDNPTAGLARLEKFRWQLQLRLGIKVELFPARTDAALIEAEANGSVQYAILPSVAFIALDRRCSCVEPLVQPTTADHQRGFRAMIVARSDSTVTKLDDAKGLRLSVGPKDSLSGRLAPFAEFAAEGIAPDEYFARVTETADSNEALRQLAAGDTDLAIAWSVAADPLSVASGSGPIADLAEEGVLLPGTLRVVWQSELIPFGPHVVRRDMPQEAKAALSSTLVALGEDAPDAYDAVERTLSGGYVIADEQLYRRFAAILDAVATPP